MLVTRRYKKHMFMKATITLLLTLLSLQSVAQEITGRITTKKAVPVANASVTAMQGNIVRSKSTTNNTGSYTIKQLDPGYYNLLITTADYDTIVEKSVVVTPGDITTRNYTLSRKSPQQKDIVVIQYRKPLVDQDKPSSRRLSPHEIATIPTTEATDLVTLSPGLRQSKRGANVNIGGGRTSGTLYIIDGVQVRGGNYAAAPPPPPYEQKQKVQFYDPSEASYKKNPENDFMNVKASPLSTMSVDVDRASYSNVRRFINEGQKPPADAVRIEELINYFDYDYPQPEGKDPIAIQTELTDCPWQEKHKLLHIGMQALKVNTDNLPPSNLVFLIDVSGSMESPERLPLLIAGMKLLVNNLRSIDKVTIVTYAGNAGLELPPTRGDRKQTIIDALDRLRAGGSTAGGAGIMLAYKMAEENFIKGGNNRVLLATDGDFNVGVSSENELEDMIVKKRATGVYLTCLGFGTDNYKDSKMEMLADKGNGNYSYIDNILEAQKTLVSEFGGTLFTVAKDVKAQIEFNPSKVQGYRLVGYENRLLNTEDFKDDKKDAGDMGSGHTVTILYEIIPAGVNSEFMRATNDLKYQAPYLPTATYTDELATIKFRYKQPDGETSKEMVHTIADNTLRWENATENTRFSASVAMFGMLLKDAKYKGTSTYEDVISMAANSKSNDKEGYRAEFVRLVKAVKEYAAKTTAR